MEELLQTPIAERISPGLFIEALVFLNKSPLEILLAHRGGKDFVKTSGPSPLSFCGEKSCPFTGMNEVNSSSFP